MNMALVTMRRSIYWPVFLLLILTGASNRSKHVLREVERAAHCQNHLLTFRIEPIWPISLVPISGLTDSDHCQPSKHLYGPLSVTKPAPSEWSLAGA